MSGRPRVITEADRTKFEGPADPPDGQGRSGGVGPWPSWFVGPVGWMLSPELVASLRSIARQRLDPRRWMRLDDGAAHLEDGGAKPGRIGPRAEVVAPASKELWFDYISDVGDGFAAMYSVAYLLQADLALVDRPDRDALAPADLRPDADGRYPIALHVIDPIDRTQAAAANQLPRGQFLFFGGDTAYHVADRATLVSRLQAPMYWAAKHLDDAGHLDAGERRLYGIPGNHDWYDDLDGFSRVFRDDEAQDEPRARRTTLAHDRLEAARPIDLYGFQRAQRASYVGLALPWNWQLWGLDIDQRLDARQRRYFQSLRVATPPDKLVLCTPSPAVVFHRVDASDAHEDALDALDLPRLHADPPNLQLPDNPVAPGTCRLDLSGDVHHYARYKGAWRGGDSDADTSFQSVVSGLGGAFLHSTDTVHSGREPVAVFPAERVARRACARGVQWTTLLSGGWMRVVPLLLCLGLSWVLLQDGAAPHLTDRFFVGLGVHPCDVPPTRDVFAPDDPMRLQIVFPCDLPEHLETVHDDPRAAVVRNVWLKMFVMLLGPGLLVGAFFFARHVSRRHARDPGAKVSAFDLFTGAPLGKLFDPTSTYAVVSLLAGAGLALLVLGPRLLPGYPHDQTSDVLVVWLVVAAPILAGVVTGWKLGAGRPTGPRIAGGLIGAAHLLIQLATLILLTRLWLTAWPWILGACAVYLLVELVLAWFFVRTNTPIWITGLVWLLTLAGFAYAIVHPTDHLRAPETDTELVLTMLCPALLAMLVGCAHFGWYLALMSRLMFHNNELGGAAKVDDYRQFIRFRVTPTAITGYVIGLTSIITRNRPSDPPITGATLRPILLDTFTVSPRPAAPPAPAPPVPKI